MKLASIAFGAVLLTAMSAHAAKMSDVCLEASDVDHTSVLNDQTILFHMRGGKVWKNTLPSVCPGLGFEHAFSEDIRGASICSNRQMIRVVNRGTRCSLGAFTPYAQPSPANP